MSTTQNTPKARKLGSTQTAVLNALRTHGAWPGRGWEWGTPRETRRILDTLVTRGVVEKVERPGGMTVYYPAGTAPQEGS